MNDIIDRAMRGEATPGELSELAAWREASPENELQYRDMVGLLRALGDARPRQELRPPRAAELLDRMARRDESMPKGQNGAAGRWLSWAVAAAAVVVAIVVGWSARRSLPAGGWRPAEIVTGAGELATVHLGDGSVARLAPRSRLRILSSPNERLVALDGQAFFAVTRQSDRPFRVRARDGDAVALGTRFEVATNARGFRLIVLDGRVAVSGSAGSAATEVSGGEVAGVVDGYPLRTSAVTDDASLVAWMGRFLAFQSTPLPRVAGEIERMYGVRVVIEDSALAGETVSASFTDEPFRQVAGVVCAVIGGRCAISDSVVTISR